MKRILILGDTITASMAGAFLARAYKKSARILIAHPENAAPNLVPPAFLSRAPLATFHAALALNERDLVRYCAATFRLATRLVNWPEQGETHILPSGEFGAALGTIPFHQAHARLAADRPVPPLTDFALAARAGLAGRFAHPSPDPNHVGSTYSYGLHLNGPLYGDFMRRCAIHYGAAVQQVTLHSLVREGDTVTGFINTADAAVHPVDLVIDTLPPYPGHPLGGRPAWIDWTAPLGTWHVRWEAGPASANLSLSELVVSEDALRLAIPLQNETATMILSRTSPGGAESEGAETIEPGRVAAPWSGNVLRLARAACILPPQFGAHQRTVSLGLETFACLLPVAGGEHGEREEYNRLVGEAYDRLAEYEHLMCALGPPAFRAGPIEPASPLARKVEQFVSRGRLVTYDKESHTAAAWLAAYLACGLKQARYDPQAGPLAPDMLATTLANMEDAITRAAAQMPDQFAYLARAGALKPGAASTQETA